LATGASFTASNVTGTSVYWVEQSNGTCIGSPRTRVVVSVFTPLAQTTVTAGAGTATTVPFSWTAVTGATGYEVSVNGGAFITPSSGATGLTHTVTGLSTLQQVCIVVRAVGANSCQNSTSASVCGCTNSAAVVTPATTSICNGTTTTFTVTAPVTGITYRWFTVATGGTPVFTGTSFTTPAITATTTYFVEQANTTTGCTSTTRTSVTVTVLPPLAQAVVRVDSVGANFVTFGWNAVPGAASYQVSLDNGVTWITPSSGATGLSHTAAPLTPLQEVTIIVRAIGNIPCQNSISNAVTGRARPDEIFIPNTFTPNGDGLNDVLLVYGYTIRSMQFMVFNQWGQKIFESNNQRSGWDGRYKGKMQPSGVYIYVSKMTLIDGSVITRKGSVNLVR
jgi:gliding motility-associated-like protein